MAKRAGFLAQILPHRGEVKRLRLCFLRSSAQIQSRGLKRKGACFYTNPSWSWGAKRARTALSGARPRWLSACSLPRRLKRWRVPPKALSGPGSCGGRRRDWASLGDDGPACLIAQLVLANDVADYVRFRAVCRAWRRSSPDPRAHGDGRFHPRQWIMLDKAAGPRCHRFLNVATGECIRTDLQPDLAEHTLHAVTPEGLLLLLHRPTMVVRLLNPLTRGLIDLPPATTLLTEQQLSRQQGGGELREHLCVYSAGIADAASTTVAIYFRFPMGIAVAKPGDQRWTMVYDRYVDATLSFAGRFYCAIGTSVMVLECDSASSSDHPRLVTAVKRSFPMSRMADSLHLVDNAGELMLVHRLVVPWRDNADAHGEGYKMDYRVYRVDLEAGALVPVMGLNGRAVFIGHCRTISVPPGAFSSISADTLYLGSDFDEKIVMNKIEAYNVADGSTQPYNHYWIDVAQPYRVVDCISHCITSSGRHLV